MKTVEDDRDLFGSPSASCATSAQQLPLPLVWSDRAAEGGFLIGPSNEDAVRYILAPETWTVPVTLLTGPEGSGKSHLGALFTARTGGDVIDYDTVQDEEAVFHAWNRALASESPMLLITRDAQLPMHVQLADLQTRLASTPHVAFAMPDERLASGIVERLLAARGLGVTPDLAAFAVARIERSYTALMAAVAAIDAAKTASGRVLGERLIRDALVAAGMFDAGTPSKGME